jgi:hypothetical protein
METAKTSLSQGLKERKKEEQAQDEEEEEEETLYSNPCSRNFETCNWAKYKTQKKE